MIFYILIGILLLVIVLSFLLYFLFPLHNNWKHAQYDACIILGSPAKENGQLSRMQKSRMDRAIQIYQQGRVLHLIISGGGVANEYCEADVMAEYALTQGIPPTDIILEKQAQNTYDNLRLSKELCQQHHFTSVAVVSSCFHIRRAAFFTKKFFSDFVMIPTTEKEKARHYISEYFRMWNTLRYEWKLRKKG